MYYLVQVDFETDDIVYSQIPLNVRVTGAYLKYGVGFLVGYSSTFGTIGEEGVSSTSYPYEIAFIMTANPTCFNSCFNYEGG